VLPAIVFGVIDNPSQHLPVVSFEPVLQADDPLSLKRLFTSVPSGEKPKEESFDGFVKILADAKTDEVLGVHMIGARCADLIAEAVVAMEFRASAEDISRMSHAHPTFAEAIKEAASMLKKQATSPTFHARSGFFVS